MNIMRKKLLEALPISRPPLVIRKCERSDMDMLAAWPAYPHPYGSFAFSFANLGTTQIDLLFCDRESREDRIALAVDNLSAKAIGYIAPIEIDWECRESGNMTVRVHPEWCGKGIGGAMLETVGDWWFRNGMKRLCLDVASSNIRAIRCYEKVGFTRFGEFWREDAGLKSVDFADPKWRFLDGHVRFGLGVPEVRFLLMELRTS